MPLKPYFFVQLQRQPQINASPISEWKRQIQRMLSSWQTLQGLEAQKIATLVLQRTF